MKAGLLALLFLPALAAQTPAPTPPASEAGATPAADPLDALVADSPFGAPAGGGRNTAPGSTGPLELRSIVFVDGGYQFSIYDQGTNKSEWVKIGEKGFPFMVRSFNHEKDSLTVEHQGRTVVLALRVAKTGSALANAAPAGPSPLPGRNGPNPPPMAPQNGNANAGGPASPGQNAPGTGPTPPTATSNTNAAEAQRLQNLADEIRRRRGTGPQLVLPKRN